MSIQKIQKPILIQQNPQGQSLYRAPDGQALPQQQARSIFVEQVAQRTNQRNQAVQEHEAAHQSVAGAFGGGETIEFGSDQLGNPLATDGHVNVQMPSVVTPESSLANIEKAQEHARIVAASAIAPEGLGGEAGQLSAADRSVYAQATAALGTADTARFQRMDFEARIALQGGKKPSGDEEIKPEMLSPVTNPQQTDKDRHDRQDRKPINLLA